jgi:hypothetical protein
MEKKVPTNIEPKGLSKWKINEALEKDLENESLDLFDDDMSKLLGYNNILNSPKTEAPSKVQPKRGAKHQTEVVKATQPKGKKGAKEKPIVEKAPMEVTIHAEEQSLLQQASRDLAEEENDLQEREKKLRTAGLYDYLNDPGLADHKILIDDLQTKLERELTITFFKTEFINNVEFDERAKAFDFSTVPSFEMNGEEMIEYLQSGLLKTLIRTCDAKELSTIFDWILMTVCSHEEIVIVDCAFTLLEHITALESKELVLEFASLNFEKLAHDYFGYDVKTSNDDILCESSRSKRKYDEFKSRESNERPIEGLHWDQTIGKKSTSGGGRTGALRSRNKSHVTPADASLALAEPKKEYEVLLHAKSNSSSNSSFDQNMDVEGEDGGGMSIDMRTTQDDKETKTTQDESMAISLEVPEFPLHNFYYFIKAMRTCVENHVFKFDDDNLLKLLQFCYASILSAKHLGTEFNYLPREIQRLILGIWKTVNNVDDITKLCRRLVASYSSYLIGFRYAVYVELVVQSPHYMLDEECTFSIRNYLSVFIMKTIVTQKVDFESARPEERVDINHGMLSLFKEVSASMKMFMKFISPETNASHKKCGEYDWQECVSVLLANSLTFPPIPKTGKTERIDDSTKEIMVEMKAIVSMIQKWESLLSDSGFKEMQAKTKIFLLKIDYENFVKDLDEFIENPTKAQLNSQNKQPPITGFFSPKK